MISARWFWCTIFTSILFFSIENSYALNFLKIDAVEIEKETESVEDSVIRSKRIMYTQRIEEAPVIDGRLSDGCWTLGEWQTNYTQFSPKYGGKASRKTEIKIFYDDKNVYAGIRAYDDMNKISRKLDRRDNFTGDLVGIHIDSYFDHRTAFEFDLTSAGQKIDVWVGNDGWDMNWNAVWYGKVAYEDSAWTVEFKIPLSQLRYGQQENQVWGLNSWRKIDRLQEEHHWNLVANDGTGLVYTFGELHGLKGLKKNKRFELAPYVSSKLTTVEKTAGNPFTQKNDFAGQGGVDALIGISNNTTLSATINPDFGQVEADPSVMNLTAFETYFEEKRPFFVEGKNIFDFIFDDDLLFYTRRIGHAPSYNPGFNNMQMPENTTIAGALKLSGKTSKGLSFGIIESVTTKEFADIYDAGEEYRQVVEPLSNYFIGRFQQEYDQGNTLIGGMLTQTHRSIKDKHLNFLSSNALTYGADFTRYWKDREYFFETKLIGSSINGDEKAISRLQTSSARYYQRPDSDNEYNPGLTKLNGIGASVKAGKWSKGHWRYNEEINYRSPGLELNDLGFMMLADLLKNNTSVSYVEKENKSVFKNYEFNFQQQNAWNSAGDGLYSQAVLSSQTEFMNSWMLTVNGSYKWRINDEQLLRGGPSMKLPDQLALDYMANTNQAKKLIVSLSGSRAIHLTGNSNLMSVSSETCLRVRSNLRFSFQTDFQKNIDELQFIQHVNTPDNSTTYLLGTIDNRNLGFTLCVDLAVTPEMTFQYYASPFVSIGKYNDFKRVTDPQSSAYDQRFTTMVPDIQDKTYYFDENLDGTADYSISNPDFNFQQFRSNLVFRWEYRAGSTIYLVWSQDRTNYDPAGSFSFHDGFKKMVDLHPKNIFMVKLSYWFSA